MEPENTTIIEGLTQAMTVVHQQTITPEMVSELRIYYEPPTGNYWVPQPDGTWIQVNEINARRRLVALGFGDQNLRCGNLKAAEAIIVAIQNHCSIHRAGPLAGRLPGVYEMGNTKNLVNVGPKLIEPNEGSFENIQSILRGLFVIDGDDTQLRYFESTLAWRVQALYKQIFTQQQAIVIAGPHGGMKTFILGHVVVPLLGGRCAKPFTNMSGRDMFNAHLAGAEVLLVDDEVASSSENDRRKMASEIKRIVANEGQNIRGQYQNAVTLEPTWNLVILLNPTLENLQILPRMEQSIEDKLMLFKVGRAYPTIDTSTLEGRVAYASLIESELPAYLHYLLRFKIPEELRGQRFGVRHFHNPELLDMIEQCDPFQRFKHLVSLAIPDCSNSLAEPVKISGTSYEIQLSLLEQLSANPQARQDLEHLLRNPASIKSYLSRLQREVGSECLRLDGKQWTLSPGLKGAIVS